MNNQEHKRYHGINNDKEILSCLGTAVQNGICFCRPTPTVSSLDRFFRNNGNIFVHWQLNNHFTVNDAFKFYGKMLLNMRAGQ